LTNKINRKKEVKKNLLSYGIISAIGIFGLISTTMLITAYVSNQFKAAAFVVKYLDRYGNNNMTIIANPVYSWIFRDVYHKAYVFSQFSDLLSLPVKTKKVLLVADSHFVWDMKSGRQLQLLYKNTTNVMTFRGGVLDYDNHIYPYTSMVQNLEGGKVEIRIRK
jgi:hypothetical protein